MKKRRSAAKTRRKLAEPRGIVAALATKRFEDQTRRLLGVHYSNKYGVRRGR